MPTTAALPKPKPRLSREEQKAQRTQELLGAAWALFCSRGYEAVTIDDVARQAGYSRMPIYSIFGDKQNLFFELWRSAVGELTALLIGDVTPGQPLRRTLKQIADAVADSASEDAGQPPGERLFFVVQTIALSRPDIDAKLTQLARDVVARFAKMIRESALAEGEKLRADPETIAAHLIAHINGMATVQFQTGNRYACARDLVAIFNAVAFKSEA